MDIFFHNFRFLSTLFGKFYEHLNMFIRIGHVYWHLLNTFLGIFVIILLFFILINQNHFKIKTTKLYYFQSQPKSIKPSQILNPTQVLFPNTIKPQLQTSDLKPFTNSNKIQIFKPKSNLKSTLSNIKPTHRHPHLQTLSKPWLY